MRKFTKEEIAVYNKIRDRQIADNAAEEILAAQEERVAKMVEVLPEYTDTCDISTAHDKLLTLVSIKLADGSIRTGRSIFSPEDRRKKQEFNPQVGVARAFNRALHESIIWV